MEEILDLEELQEEVLDENLKEFMSKDDETEKLLNEKIEELAKEEEKLSKKENEIKELEESNREKINSNASADELIEIAGKIKEAESELASINENIQKLTSEKEELIETKKSIDTSKQEYIKQLNSTNLNYEEQLKKISEAIEVCDNPTLKQVLEDVKNKKTKELADLEQKRINELKTVLNEPTEEKPEIELPVEEPLPVAAEETKDVEITSDILINNDVLDTPTFDFNISTDIEEPKISEETSTEKQEPVNMINIDSILGTDDINNLNVINPVNIDIPEVNQVDIKNENKIRVIYERDVPEALLKEIYSSSKIMPPLYDYLENKNVNEGSIN